MQDEQGQLPEKRKEDTQSVTGLSNDTDTHTGGASGENAEKAGWRTATPERELTGSDRQVVRARIDGTFSESLGVASGTREEEGRTDEMGHRSERVV